MLRGRRGIPEVLGMWLESLAQIMIALPEPFTWRQKREMPMRRTRSATVYSSFAILSAISPLTAPAHADEPDHGAYMAYATGCISCHSPHDPAGNVLNGRLLAGGDHQVRAAGGHGMYPPNITPDRDTGIGGWTEQDIVVALREGRTPDGRILSSGMPWRTQYSKLTAADMQAIAHYVISVPAAPTEKPPQHGPE